MGRTITSKDEILAAARKLIAEKGISQLNIRTVASMGGVSVGSVYHYFDSKDDLILASIESVWDDIFRMDLAENSSLIAYVDSLYHHLQKGREKYPGFFTLHSLGFSNESKNQGSNAMNQYLNSIRVNMKQILKNDSQVLPDAFETFSEDDLIDSILDTLIFSVFMMRKSMKPMDRMIERLIYGKGRNS